MNAENKINEKTMKVRSLVFSFLSSFLFLTFGPNPLVSMLSASSFAGFKEWIKKGLKNE
jgi:hypothetical protein